MVYRKIGQINTLAFHLSPYDWLPAYQDDLAICLASGKCCAGHDLRRGVVAAHRIYG